MKRERTIDEIITDNAKLLAEIKINKKRFFEKYGKK